MENECETLPGVAYPGVQDNRSTINTKIGYDDDDTYCSDLFISEIVLCNIMKHYETYCNLNIYIMNVIRTC